MWVRKMPRKDAVDRAMYYLERVRIPEQANKYPGQLSGGQQQRVAIARSLCMQPKVMLFDEPTNHLDLESIQALNNSLAEFNGTLLFTSHDHTFTETIANRIIELAPKGVLDKLMTLDQYLENSTVQEQREALGV